MTTADCGLPKDVVPPGNQTGKYYIPISNLPFNTTWQGLKDYIKPVCTVDHVEIFNKSTSGWVRVNGYNNFRAAFDHLNGKEFNGRAIIADDRNADKPLKVRDLVVSNTPGAANRPPSKTGNAATISAPVNPIHTTDSPASYSDSTGLGSPTTTTGSKYGQSSRSYTMSMSPSSYMTSPDTVYSQAVVPSWNTLASQPDLMSAYGYGSATQAYYGYPAVPDRQPAVYDHSASYAVQPVQPYGEYYAPPTTASLSSQLADLSMGPASPRPGGPNPAGGGVVYTEQRGIHIRDLSRRASEDQVRKMIREAAGREADLINLVEVPLDKDRNPRGWALVHFRSADLARRMVGVLNGAEFKGKKLEVRLLKEGETVGSSGGGVAAGAAAGGPSMSSSSRGHRSGRHHSDRRDDGARKREKDRGERGGASSKASAPSSSRSGPLVVGSSTVAEASSSRDKGKGKGKEKEKEKEKERHGGGSSSSSKFSVVIADGSVGRRRSDSDRRAT